MPAIGSISINDGQATPVAHVFSPVTTDGQKSLHQNRAGAFPAAYESLEVEVVKPKSATGAYRVEATLNRPVTATVDGMQKVVRFSKSTLLMHFNQESTLAERRDDAALWASLLANASFKTVLQDLEPYY